MNALRIQLVVILILVALLPAIPAALTVRALFRQSLDPLLGERIEAGARAGLDATRELLDAEIARFRAAIETGAEVDTLDLVALDARDRGSIEALRGAAPGFHVAPQRVTLSTGEWLVAAVAGAGRVTWLARPVPAALAARAASLTDMSTLVSALRHERGRVLGSLVSTFLVVYGVILVAVLLFGLFLASRVTRPLAALGGGIARVAGGDLEARVPESGRGPIGALLRQFNVMASRLGMQQRELVRLEKLAAWRQMARRLAHEIKNPLTPIQLAAQEMRDAYRGADADYRALLDEGTGIIEEEVASLRTLVSSFSQFSRMPDPVPAEVSLADIGHDVAALYGDRVCVRTAGGSIVCDRDQIHRAIVNLVNNAHDAQAGTGVDAPVEVEIAVDGERAIITVADRGPGVPAELAPRVFEPDITTKSDGMGLGLAIVKHTVDAHGGAVTVSARAGGGACFRIELPLVRQEGTSG